MCSASGRPLRILWVHCRLLHPLNGGDRIRTYEMLKELKRRHRISYVCLRTQHDPEESLQQAMEFCHELIAIPHALPASNSAGFYATVLHNAVSGRAPHTVQRYASAEAVKSIHDHCARQSPDLIVCDYLISMINLLAMGKRPPAPVVLFHHNVESRLWMRRLERTRNPVLRFIYEREYRLTRQFEDTCAAFVDGQIAVSEQEAHYLRAERRMANVLGAIPTGVDCDHYRPTRQQEPHTLAFLGSMDWHANVDAVEYFARAIYPQIKSREPRSRFLVIGRNPSPAVIALSRSDPSIEVTGTVGDVRPHLGRASVMVVPLRIGAGTRIKIFEAMAMGVPIVSTTLGAEGLPVTHGDDILLADQPDEFARRVCELLELRELRARVRENALQLVRGRFGWAAAAENFEAYCIQLLHNGARA